MLSYTADVFGNFKEFVVKRFDETESSQNHFCIYYIAIYHGISVLILHFVCFGILHTFLCMHLLCLCTHNTVCVCVCVLILSQLEFTKA